MKSKIILISLIVVIIGIVLLILVPGNLNHNKVDSKLQMKTEENNNTPTNVKNDFIGTVLEETTTYMIVKPNEDEEEGKIADKIRINYGTDHRDYLYGIGRKVLIYYTGYIMETYPPQINTNEIEINGYEDFELTVEKSKDKTIKRVMNNTEIDKYNSDYNLYYYNLDKVNITVNNQTMSLEEALRSGKVTIDGLIIKANKDFPNATVYKDGGSIEYHYDNYTIIKCHTINGNRDVYIGAKDLKLNDVKK